MATPITAAPPTMTVTAAAAAIGAVKRWWVLSAVLMMGPHVVVGLRPGGEDTAGKTVAGSSGKCLLLPAGERRPHGCTRPRRCATEASSVRFATASFCRMRDTWTLTVLGDM